MKTIRKGTIVECIGDSKEKNESMGNTVKSISQGT